MAVTVDEAWCSPNANAVKATGNKAEIGWFGGRGVGWRVTVVVGIAVIVAVVLLVRRRKA